MSQNYKKNACAAIAQTRLVGISDKIGSSTDAIGSLTSDLLLLSEQIVKELTLNKVYKMKSETNCRKNHNLSVISLILFILLNDYPQSGDASLSM